MFKYECNNSDEKKNCKHWWSTIGPDSFAEWRSFRESERQHEILETTHVEYRRSRHWLHLKRTFLRVWNRVPEHDISLPERLEMPSVTHGNSQRNGRH